MITAKDIVVKRRGKAVLDGASITLKRNEVVALIGANGVGKTTLFHVLAGHIKPDAGQLQQICAAEKIALLADKPALYPDWSVHEALQRLNTLYTNDHAQITALVKEFALDGVLNQLARNLSHGYRQRLAMAQMLLAQPEVMLLDEPSNGLDYAQRRAMWPLLAALKQRGAVMLISHDWTEVGAVADRVYVLRDGRCHDLAMPKRQSQWRWLSFANAETARQCCPDAHVFDGRFAAVSMQMSHVTEQVLTISNEYPSQALQEKIDALA